MERSYTKEIEIIWQQCGRIDMSETIDELKSDIAKLSPLIVPCRAWLSKRKRLKNIKCVPDSYNLKHQAESDIGEWVPHSVFVLAAYLEGFELSKSKLRGDVHVVSTNIGSE